LIATAEASSNLARYDGVRYSHRAKGVKTLSEMYRRSRDEGFGAEVKRRIMLGTYALSAGYYDAYYLKAQKMRTLLTRDFDEAFRKADIYTVTADLAGIPGISIPCGETKEKLPIGLQILGKHFDESTILRLAHAYEQA
jgi:aspartyl-tRNA(Asn)/glutamyl-tRNA(Gln) amidotransferase subunit A